MRLPLGRDLHGQASGRVVAPLPRHVAQMQRRIGDPGRGARVDLLAAALTFGAYFAQCSDAAEPYLDLLRRNRLAAMAASCSVAQNKRRRRATHALA